MSGEPELNVLAGFSPIWREPKFAVGKWEAHFFGYSDEVMIFIEKCYDTGWVLRGFDWGTWKQSAEAQKFLDPDMIRTSATPQQLAQLLTIAIRQDRFVEGGLAGWFGLGLIQAICERAKALAA